MQEVGRDHQYSDRASGHTLNPGICAAALLVLDPCKFSLARLKQLLAAETCQDLRLKVHAAVHLVHHY